MLAKMGFGQPRGFDIVNRLDLLEADDPAFGAAHHVEPIISHSQASQGRRRIVPLAIIR